MPGDSVPCMLRPVAAGPEPHAMPPRKSPPQDLKEACISAAREVIAEEGVESLSLRDVARRLGVSHQAPYRHFESRDHLLAEIMRRCFEDFARQLDARPRHRAPDADLGSLGEQYLQYAAQHPLEYRLMFGTPWPQAAPHPELAADAVHAFDVLRDALRRIHGSGREMAATVDLDALFIWSCMHGLAGILQGSVTDHLGLTRRLLDRAPDYVLQMISRAMSAPR